MQGSEMRSSRRWRWRRRPKAESWASQLFQLLVLETLFFPNKILFQRVNIQKMKMRLIPLVKVDPMIWGVWTLTLQVFPLCCWPLREIGGTVVLALFFFFNKYQVSRHALYQCFLILFGSLVWSLYFHPMHEKIEKTGESFRVCHFYMRFCPTCLRRGPGVPWAQECIRFLGLE